MYKMPKKDALKSVAEYILDKKEHDDYVDFCETHDLNPKDIHMPMNSTHIYALALIGLGYEFEE